MSSEELNLSENAIKVLEKRYLKRDEKGNVTENPEDLFRRVSKNIASAEVRFSSTIEAKQVEDEFFRMISSLEFLPNSPTLMNAGRALQQLSACFVLPVDDSLENIFETVKETAMIHKSGGGTGFSFSHLRPKDDIVLTTKGVSSGPVSFMTVFDAATEAVKQGGTRRGANMGILRVDHPDILDFITCKRDNNKINNFNISVAVTDEFMEAVEEGRMYDLVNPRTKEKMRSLNAKEVFDLITEMAWKNGDPGIIFIDRMNAFNPTPLIGEIEATNPCGEQPLLPYESCNLGSINLAKMVKKSSGAQHEINWEKLKKTVHLSVRFLDDVIEMNKYPLKKIEDMTKANRKIGLGIMGFADMLIMLGIPYNTKKAMSTAEKVMRFVQEESKKASEKLAFERGEFANFKGSIYDVQNGPKIRNATTTTLAPTGTISIIAACSSGIEPLFAISYIRRVMDNAEMVEVHPLFKKIAMEAGFYSDELMKKIAEHGSVQGIEEVPEDIRRVFVTAHDINADWHIRMQSVFQKYTDNAVSKTVNFANNATKDDIKNSYLFAYKEGCKGITIYRDKSRETQVLNIESRKEENRKPHGIVPRERPSQTLGKTIRIGTGCGNLYVTVNEDQSGLCEVFAKMGKSGGCAASQSEAISRLISLCLRCGIDKEAILKQVKGIRCPSPLWVNGGMILSCPDAIAKTIEQYIGNGNGHGHVDDMPDIDPVIAAAATAKAKEPVPVTVSFMEERDIKTDMCPECPECGSMVDFTEGCIVCRSCGYSKCW
ncbi:MAG: vitamin B12-dependent ribonucleotide reductase [Candidatus Saganbacteria bacterium]|nr:vitamin B12-dependent ribonucleotide reductase [Candidatus Saganbacteria bacterium]